MVLEANLMTASNTGPMPVWEFWVAVIPASLYFYRQLVKSVLLLLNVCHKSICMVVRSE